MLETMIAAGKLAGGLGTLASGLGFGGSGGDGIDVSENARLMREQYAQQIANIPKIHEANIQHSVDQTMKTAKAQGIHPMYLLGNVPQAANVSASVMGGSGGGSGRDYAQAGRGLEKMSQGLEGIAGKEVSKAMTELGLRQARAETLKSEYGAELDYINLQRLKQEANANQESAVTFAAKPTPKQKKILLSKGRGGGSTDVSGMEKVDPWNEYFGEIGELEQSLRNYYHRYKAELLRRRARNREANKRLSYPRTGGSY